MEFLRPHNPEFCRIPVFRRDIFCFLRHRRQRFPAKTAHHGHRLLPQAVKENKTCRFSLLLILWLLFSPFVQNHNLLADSVSGKPDRPFVSVDLSSFFPENEGCFVLYDKNKDQYSIYNEKMSRQRVSRIPPIKYTAHLPHWMPA